MPREGAAGFSDNTPRKQEHFHTIMTTEVRAVKGILRRHRWTLPCFWYLDLNAGPGWYPRYHDLWHPHGLMGSPLIALTAAREARVPFEGFLIDHDPAAIRALHTYLPDLGGLVRQAETTPTRYAAPHGPYAVTVCPGDSADYTPGLIQRGLDTGQALYGVIYSDVNGGTVPFAELAAYSHAFPYVDLVIHFSATHRKRVQGAHGTRPPLVTVLETIKKKHWMVRTPYWQEQWTFLIGTNWDAFPQFARQGFWPADSPQGQEILHRISYRTGEQG